MTRQTFYRKLRKHAGKFKWTLRGGSLRGECDGECFCPITAVFYAERQRYRPPGYFHHAADDLGMSYKEACIIASAADAGDKLPIVRKTLLRSVNLLRES